MKRYQPADNHSEVEVPTTDPTLPGFAFVACDEPTIALVRVYAAKLDLRHMTCLVTTNRKQFGAWLGRPIPAAYGGAYAYDPRADRHLVLINLERIDLSRPQTIEIVVCEELLHMRDRLDGDLRRHAKHGYDRIAHRVAVLVGVSLDDVRQCLRPPATRPFRYRCRCNACGWEVLRKRRGRWACPRCWRSHRRMVPLSLHSLAEGTKSP